MPYFSRAVRRFFAKFVSVNILVIVSLFGRSFEHPPIRYGQKRPVFHLLSTAMALFCTPCGHQTVLMQQISNLRPITAGFRGHRRPPDPKDHQREPTGMVPDPRQTTAAQARTIIRHVSRRSRHGRTVRNRPCAGRRARGGNDRCQAGAPPAIRALR